MQHLEPVYTIFLYAKSTALTQGKRATDVRERQLRSLRPVKAGAEGWLVTNTGAEMKQV